MPLSGAGFLECFNKYFKIVCVRSELQIQRQAIPINDAWKKER